MRPSTKQMRANSEQSHTAGSCPSITHYVSPITLPGRGEEDGGCQFAERATQVAKASDGILGSLAWRCVPKCLSREQSASSPIRIYAFDVLGRCTVATSHSNCMERIDLWKKGPRWFESGVSWSSLAETCIPPSQPHKACLCAYLLLCLQVSACSSVIGRVYLYKQYA